MVVNMCKKSNEAQQTLFGSSKSSVNPRRYLRPQHTTIAGSRGRWWGFVFSATSVNGMNDPQKLGGICEMGRNWDAVWGVKWYWEYSEHEETDEPDDDVEEDDEMDELSESEG